VHYTYTAEPSISSIPTYNLGGLRSNTTFEPAYFGASVLQTGQNLVSKTSPGFQSAIMANTPDKFEMGGTADPSYNAVPAVSTTGPTGPNFIHWLWADADPSVDVFANVDIDAINNVNMDLDNEVDWYNWVESAKDMEWNAESSGYG
jgi:hypothetical protein